MSAHDTALSASSGKPNARDLAFLALMLAVLAAVALMGVFTFREGLKTEATKLQGEAFVAWLAQAKAKRAAADFAPAACAMVAQPAGRAKTWSECSAALLADGGPLAGVRNAFSGQPIGLIARCDPASNASPGQFVIDRVSATPPGSAVPLLVAPFAPEDTLDKALTIKLTVCDKGGYGVKIGEVEF
ncbi:MAG: hypothetical protein WCK08_02940 [Betaproteobacteria bacterium]|jgi:hypothetical protein